MSGAKKGCAREENFKGSIRVTLVRRREVTRKELVPQLRVAIGNNAGGILSDKTASTIKSLE